MYDAEIESKRLIGFMKFWNIQDVINILYLIVFYCI